MRICHVYLSLVTCYLSRVMCHVILFFLVPRYLILMFRNGFLKFSVFAALMITADF